MPLVPVVAEKVSQSDTLKIDVKSHASLMKRGSFIFNGLACHTC